MKEIVIVDDDVHIGNVLEELLIQEGYGVLRAYSGTEALLLLEQRQPDLILLDLILPGLNGEEILPQIKTIPVIILSAKVDIDNKVNLLLEGAVDYVMKPFNTKELLARIAVQFRKLVTDQTVSKLVFDDIVLDLHQCTIYVSDVQVKLTRTEYAILKLLMQRPDQVMTKSILLEQISEDTPDCTEASLKIHVSNLRKKLRQVNGRNYIEAVWGIGFKLKTE
ncbi:response regulator transcription factor [Candidatus Enterococcus ferrettii]|uniref:Stage 0 sporulation protein A homolog n=1 Tax=Candidatus Enterococcus ferrettii TaxID=2815324 RepID=A0ABV0ELB0_9ENTE|nr:response regulator transcription factor [Enterococcus sp. 665A]MBO1340034.1 response regulator transcription factor [Enterococcus sp. 665A]